MGGIRRGSKGDPNLFQGIVVWENTINTSSGWGILSDHFTLFTMASFGRGFWA